MTILLLNHGDFDIENNNLYLHIVSPSIINDTDEIYYFTDNIFTLNFNGKYYERYTEDDGSDTYVYYFSISNSSVSSFVELIEDSTYYFVLSSSSRNLGGSYSSSSLTFSGDDIFDAKVVTIGGLTAEDIERNRTNALIKSNNETTKAIEEQTEVSRGILGKIVDILSYINPLSENFFGRKLVELSIDGLKALFIPSNDFFSDWFGDFNEWLGDRFGILYFPIEITFDFLNRFNDVEDTGEYVLTVPSFNLSFMDYNVTIFNGIEYDFNDLIENETFENIHSVYLLVVDVILYLGLAILAYNVFAEVVGSHVIDDSVQSYYDTHSKPKPAHMPSRYIHPQAKLRS